MTSNFHLAAEKRNTRHRMRMLGTQTTACSIESLTARTAPAELRRSLSGSAAKGGLLPDLLEPPKETTPIGAYRQVGRPRPLRLAANADSPFALWLNHQSGQLADGLAYSV